MLEEGAVSNFSGSIQVGLVDTKVTRGTYHYSIPSAASEVSSNVLPGIAVSVEEKVSDLIQSYPHLEAFLKSHSKDTNARIRDLAISSQERDQLLYQIIAARRQQPPAFGTTGRASQSARSWQFGTRSYGPRRKRPARRLPTGVSRLSRQGFVRRGME